MAKLTKFITGGASAISRLPSFLIGLLIIVVLAGGAYGAWRVVSHCNGQSLGACFLSAINPLQASYGRGAGEPLRCGDNEEMDAGLCYAKCQAGYKGVGPVCWQEACPAGFRDDGTFCAKPQSYGTGAGYPWKFGDTAFDFDTGPRSRCEADNGKDNCYRSGDIWYPKCRTNFHKVGDLVCSPNCPSGMTDIGVSCTKKSVGRGVGVPIHACADDMIRMVRSVTRNASRGSTVSARSAGRTRDENLAWAAAREARDFVVLESQLSKEGIALCAIVQE